MKMAAAFLTALLFLGTSEVFAQSCTATPGGNPAVVFIDSGSDTATQSGFLGLVCTIDWTPMVTGAGGGTGYDFSGYMLNVKNPYSVPFTGKWDLKPPGTAGNPFFWTFTATATGLTAAPPGLYSTNLTFTVEP